MLSTHSGDSATAIRSQFRPVLGRVPPRAREPTQFEVARPRRNVIATPERRGAREPVIFRIGSAARASCTEVIHIRITFWIQPRRSRKVPCGALASRHIAFLLGGSAAAQTAREIERGLTAWSALAASSIVAPVVRTSSMSSTCIPASVRPRRLRW